MNALSLLYLFAAAAFSFSFLELSCLSQTEFSSLTRNTAKLNIFYLKNNLTLAQEQTLSIIAYLLTTAFEAKYK
jgi:hypothetical protein